LYLLCADTVDIKNSIEYNITSNANKAWKGNSRKYMKKSTYDLRLGLILTKNLFFVFQLKKMLHVYVCNFIEYNSTSKHRKEVQHERIYL